MAPPQMQDSFIDDEDECCPLCVEPFDLSDKNFKPCVCGYQVCQFCFNNIKNNMNGLCPACRRPYDERTMEFKVVTSEELAQHRATLQKNAKKKAEQRQKEAQKREVESLNRKHLAGLRVVQKNLVYVMGLSPGIREEDLLQTLRGDKYFGQYGKIIKIVVSKAKAGEPSNNQSLGVYVTFARKEDAARCIAAVNGSQNGDRVLRAQLGTTKYCSAYLRNEVCTNKQCMFLHEPGDNDDSYSRQDLSSINSVNTQNPYQAGPSTPSSSRVPPQPQPPVQQTQPVAAAAQPMAREISKDGSEGDGSALPSTASWANRGTQHQSSRRGSHATSVAASSPAVSAALPVPQESTDQPEEPTEPAVETPSDEQLPAPADPPQSPNDPVFAAIFKAINNPNFRFICDPEEMQAVANFLPLFEDNGGAKRQAMREQEAARLSLEREAHESQNDTASVPEAREASEVAEEEEPESGSLQLGGEPEDNDSREGSREPLQGLHDQRRPSSQMPIQRGNDNMSPYSIGSGQTYRSNVGDLSSINGRTLTPLQQRHLESFKSPGQAQPNFLDQFPPGIAGGLGQASSQSALFQQQGHNRQSSRYSFATDAASSVSGKAANTNKLMAQQNSMIPQQGQFYGTSMPAPPPGLKSTSSTPVNGGGMFGQGVGFGGASFGGLGKDHNGDLLRELARNRGGSAASGGQLHDTGKREFMFPSFLHQYPSSSTPSPASGLLASLYGSQPGAFHDFGPKQKKKGKKHRHANTSSSGGGGLVDLVDPSILQARMHHQQQSGAGVGQGMFGSQSQDDQGLFSLDEVSSSVDALVADSDAEITSNKLFDHVMRNSRPATPAHPPGLPLSRPTSRPATPSLPPGLPISRPATPSIPPGFNISRSSTPTIPPGLALPHAHPSPHLREEKLAKATGRPATAFTPTRAASTQHIPSSLANVSLPPTPTPTKKSLATPADKAKESVKAFAQTTGLSKAIVDQTVEASKSVLESEDFPSLNNKGKGKETVSTVTSKATPAAKPVTVTPISKVAAVPAPTLPKPNEKPNTPALPNLTTSSPAVSPNVVSTSAKSVPVSAAFPPLPPTTPAAVTPGAAAASKGPKTLRVISTPKVETPNTGVSTPTSATSINHPSFPPLPRQISLASHTRTDRPGTPASEIISEDASITSTSQSRANSPPPSRVGAAPVRQITKSQQKKLRREVQREREKFEMEATPEKAEEKEIAPIQGRKKKQKKEKSAPAPAKTAAASISVSPAPSTKKEEPTPEVEAPKETKDSSLKQEEPKLIESKTRPQTEKVVPKEEALELKVQTLAPEPVEQQSLEKSLTPAVVLQSLIAEGLAPLNKDELSILKSPAGFNHRHEFTFDVQDLDQKLTITDEDKVRLFRGEAVHKIAQGSGRIMLTPNGDCVRNLTQEEEERYLDLQDAIAEESGPTAFVSSRHHAGTGFTLIGGRAVPNGPPTYFPTDETIPPVDPVSKIQRDEALNYINQYVLPSLATNSQLEKALNASALDVGAPTDAAGWAAWGVEPVNANGEYNEQPYGASNDDGILATGLESMTAHFAVGRDNGRGQHLGNVTLLSLPDCESAIQTARKESEKLEKSFNQLLKKNRKLLTPAGH